MATLNFFHIGIIIAAFVTVGVGSLAYMLVFGRDCESCKGTGWLRWPPKEQVDTDSYPVECAFCKGSGQRYWPPRWKP